jgi:hypothetical protein
MCSFDEEFLDSADIPLLLLHAFNNQSLPVARALLELSDQHLRL